LPFRADSAALVLAIAVHAWIGTRMLDAPLPPKPRPKRTVEVALKQKPIPPPPPTPPVVHDPKPKKPRRALAKKAAPPEAKPKSTPPPVFGFSMESAPPSAVGVSVPLGNTTAVDPSLKAHGGSVQPLPGGGARDGAADGDGELSIRTEPEIDTEACGRLIQYPREAAALGIAGDVKLRVSLDEKGRVRNIHVLKGLGHGLDEEAADALRRRCKFKPAIASNGHAVAYVIEPYIFHFEIPR
jgi:TonB family protein